jgi:glycosyltransferase involved in cell wall biosynthesis
MIHVLFQGWSQVQHSYGIVMAFLLVHLHKNYNDKITIYVQEMPYYNAKWNESKKMVYNEEYNNILSNFKQYNGEKIDLIYRQTFPYNISIYDANIPKCIFYTSEFGRLDPSYFHIDGVKILDNQIIQNHLNNNKNIFFTTPSLWSSNGLKEYTTTNDRIITHGVDTTIFYKHTNSELRNKIRKLYSVNETDILLINIGAMTGNKGITLILQTLHVLINKLNKTQFKLLLKGSDDLYTCQQFLEQYLMNLHITFGELEKLKKNIIFTNKTLQFKSINDLYNAADLYISPYLCEGFNLTVLEALSSGLSVVVPTTGSTKEYIEDIYKNGGKDYIYYIPSKVLENNSGYFNDINTNDILNILLQFKHKESHLQYDQMFSYIETHYSWNYVSSLLYEYFLDIIQ